MIRVLLVDDHALFRTGLTSILREAGDIDVVGEAANGEAALDQVRLLAPDLVLMDVNMPGIGGIEATRKILRKSPNVRIVAVTALSEEPFPNHLLDAGAMGYISKGCPATELFEAIRSVMAGNHFISKEVAQKLAISQVAGQNADSPLRKLSAREMQVMTMIVSGQGTQQISDALFLSPKTVSTYRHRLYEKLGVSNDVELTHFALRHNVIEQS
ncbi:MAG: response regulator [Gammaproteobacteria bacterium]|nr:response regulator [Gammaproteobacteria bacterium]